MVDLTPPPTHPSLLFPKDGGDNFEAVDGGEDWERQRGGFDGDEGGRVRVIGDSGGGGSHQGVCRHDLSRRVRGREGMEGVQEAGMAGEGAGG